MKWYYVLFLIVFTLFVSACKKRKDQPVIGISFETLQTEYWVASFEAIKAECRKNNLDYIVSVANGDAYRQFEQVNNFISRGVDGIVISPKDSHTIIPIIKACNRAGIPISVYNRMPATEKHDFTAVIADNYQIAKNTVEYMVELAKKTGKKHKALILIGDLGDINAINRRKGFDEAVEANPEVVEVVAEVPTEWNQEKALAGVTNSLQAHPDINFIFSSSDFLFPSVISALRNTDKYHPIGHEKHVILGGFDGDPLAYQMLQSGYLDADGVQDVFFECSIAVQAVLKKMNGQEVEKVIVDPGFVIHQDNLDVKKNKMWGAGFK